MAMNKFAVFEYAKKTAELGNIEVVNTLLKNGATAIGYAHNKGFTQVEALLEKAYYRACNV